MIYVQVLIKALLQLHREDLLNQVNQVLQYTMLHLVTAGRHQHLQTPLRAAKLPPHPQHVSQIRKKTNLHTRIKFLEFTLNLYFSF